MDNRWIDPGAAEFGRRRRILRVSRKSAKKILLSLMASVALAAEKYVAFEFHIFPAFS